MACVPFSSVVQQPPLGEGGQRPLVTTNGLKPLGPVRGMTGFVRETQTAVPDSVSFLIGSNMNRWLRVGTVWLALATALLPRLSLRAEDEAVPTDRLLPREVSVYVSVPDVDELKARFAKTAFGTLTQDSAFASFKGEITKALEGVSSAIEKELGVSLKELLEIPSGEFAFAVLTPQGKKPAVVMFLDFGDNEKTVDALMEKAEKALEENAESDDEEIDGTKITTWTFKNGADKPNQLVYFVKNTMLVASSDLDTAKGVLARWDGKHSDTFADNDNYNLILEKCSTDDEDGLFVWYVNPMGLIQAAVTQVAGAESSSRAGDGIPRSVGHHRAQGDRRLGRHGHRELRRYHQNVHGHRAADQGLDECLPVPGHRTKTTEVGFDEHQCVVLAELGHRRRVHGHRVGGRHVQRSWHGRCEDRSDRSARGRPESASEERRHRRRFRSHPSRHGTGQEERR